MKAALMYQLADSSPWQSVAAGLVVAVTLAIFARRAWKRWKRPANGGTCGGSCGCPTGDLKSKTDAAKLEE